jgi:intracellular septation protein
MKFLFDLIPVLIFFAVFELAGLDQEAAAASATHLFGWMAASGVIVAKNGPTMWATVATVLGTLLQITWLKLRRKHVDRMLLATFGIVVTLGAATVWFQNDAFIRVKPTVVYWMFATVLLVAEVGFKRNLAQAAMAQAMQLPAPVWRKVLWSWIGCFVFLGAANLYVAFNFPIETWVKFKVFGLMGLTFVFLVVQVLMLSKYIVEDPQE